MTLEETDKSTLQPRNIENMTVDSKLQVHLAVNKNRNRYSAVVIVYQIFKINSFEARFKATSKKAPRLSGSLSSTV